MNPFSKRFELGQLRTNAYVVGCTETKEAIVIDPSDDGLMLARYIREQGWTLSKILLTHAHFDHVGGLADLKAEFPHVPILGHMDADVMLVWAQQSAMRFQIHIPQPPPLDKMIEPNEMIQVGNLSLKALYTPGHSPGHYTFYHEASGMAWVGDAIFHGSIGRTDLPGGDYQTLIDSINQEILTLPDNVKLYSGHGPATTVGRERKLNPFLNR